MNFHDLQTATAGRTFTTEAELNQFLREAYPYASPEERIAMKILLESNGCFRPGGRNVKASLATDEPLTLGELSIDRRGHYVPEPAPLDPQMAALFRRARLEAGRSYSLAEIDERLTAAALDATERMAVKHFLSTSGLLRAAGASVQATADTRPRGKLLVNAKGQPITLQSCSW